MIEEPGLYELDAATYHADPAPEPSLNNSLLATLLDSPYLAWFAHPRLNPGYAPPEASAKMDLGTVAHKLLLGAGADLEVIDAADYRTKAAQERRDWAREQGKVPVLGDQLDTAQGMVDAIQPQLRGFDGLSWADLSTGKKEVGLFWCEPGYAVAPPDGGPGVWGRNLIDWLRDDLPSGVWESWDYKTTGVNINPDSMALSIHFVENGYATQCALQERGLTTLFPKLAGRIKFRRIFQSTEPPYPISIVEPDPATMTIAHKQVDRAFRIWAHCLATDEWPGYPKRIVTLRHAEHLATRWLERELADEEADRERIVALKRNPGRPRHKTTLPYTKHGKRILTPRIQVGDKQTIVDAG